MLQEMFGLHLPVLEKIIRPLLVYAALVILLRIFGKRELAQMNPFDLVVLLMLSNTVQNAIIGEDNSVTGGVLGALALLTINYVVVRFVLQHRRLDQILAGDPTVLMAHGQVLRPALASELISVAELRLAAMRQGYHSLDEIDGCVLEPGGLFTFAPKASREHPKDVDRVLRKLDELQAEVHALRRG